MTGARLVVVDYEITIGRTTNPSTVRFLVTERGEIDMNKFWKMAMPQMVAGKEFREFTLKITNVNMLDILIPPNQEFVKPVPPSNGRIF